LRVMKGALGRCQKTRMKGLKERDISG
jgi:hypothetical protein